MASWRQEHQTIDLVTELADRAVEGPVVKNDLAVELRDAGEASILAIPNAEIVDLGHNQLKSVPAEVKQLKNLRRLNLIGNPLESVVDIFGLVLDWTAYDRLKDTISDENVVGLHFQNTPPRLPRKLLDLENLRYLSISGVSEHLPEGIEDLQSLDELYVEAQAMSVFPKKVLRLRSLKKLTLQAWLSAIPDDLAELGLLRKLALNQNPLGKLPNVLRLLPQLRYVNLSGTRQQQLPEWLGELQSLEVLWLTRNEIRELPETISELRRLTALVVINNQLEDLPASITRLDRLRALCIGQNPMTQIPDAVFSLRALEGLDLRPARGESGLITTIPDKILDLPNLRILECERQPIETPPAEVVAKGLDGIRAYYRQLEREGKDYICEAKLLIVGEPGAGKTSLARKIEDPNYQLRDDEKSTEGIGVLNDRFPTLLRVEGNDQPLARDFHVSIWDFGGQEIYHATHQFFLTRRSLYVLVADNRKEDTDFQYWMNIVELLSDGSPLLIVKNEKQDRRRDINESRLRGRFPNLRAIHATNLATNRGLAEAVRAIREELERLPHIGTPLPRTWRRVREALEQDGRDYVSIDEYLEICGRHGFTREEDMLQLSGFLHDLGVCLHFLDDPLLRKVVMLKPKWATDAVYRVLDNKGVIDRHGRFSRKDLDAIWSEPRYASMRDELVQLMMKFQLCYPLSSSAVTFIAPQLLESSPPEYPWDDQGNLVVHYEYEFMPKGILTRFIVATHFMIPREEWLWRDGVILEREGTRAEVTEDYPQRRITVRLAGPEKQELMAIIDHELDRIHRGYPRLRMNRLIPCRCAVCAERPEPHFFSYERLRQFARDGEPIQCPESYRMVNVPDLIAAVFPASRVLSDRIGAVPIGDARPQPAEAPDPGKEVFVSYAWGGQSEEVVYALERTFRAFGVAIVRDKTNMRYKDSIQHFMRRIGLGKAIVVVLSRKYLESKNCMFELAEIAKCGELYDRVFPIVLPDAEIFDPVQRVGYVKFWENKITELNSALKGVNQENLHGIREELDVYARIRETISGLMALLADMNALSLESHTDSQFAALVSSIEARLQK